jgi:glycosyltransferase involved in cell wall biosynthesis
MSPNARQRLTVIILTKDEGPNLPFALDSVCGWADEVLVCDSGSKDGTIEIAHAYQCRVVSHPFETYGKQRNAAIELARGSSDWILFLDADEMIPDALKVEIDHALRADSDVDGYYLKFRLMWQGTWVRRGYYPNWILRLARTSAVSCEDRSVNERLQVGGRTSRLQSDFIHEDRKGIAEWVAKHNRYAAREAEEAAKSTFPPEQMEGRLFGAPPERSRWLRIHIWNRLPLIARPFVYFAYRYLIRGGFLDGSAGLTYHFMHGLWYPMLIDLKYLELRARRAKSPSSQRIVGDPSTVASSPSRVL